MRFLVSKLRKKALIWTSERPVCLANSSWFGLPLCAAAWSSLYSLTVNETALLGALVVDALLASFALDAAFAAVVVVFVASVSPGAC